MSDATGAGRGTVRRAAMLMRLLKGNSLQGLPLSKLSAAIEESPSTVLRTLQAMAEERLVRQLESGAWALDIELLSIAVAHEQEINRTLTRTQELAARVRAQAAS